MKKISIITPLYNAEKFIGEAIESVQKQSYPCWEMIIVDDCSTDDSWDIVRALAIADDRITVLRNEINLGGAETRNVAIKVAVGEFIAFLDADDLWDRDKLSAQLKFMLDNKVGFSFTEYKMITESGKYLGRISTPTKVSLKDMYSNNFIGCLTVMYDVAYHGKFFLPDIRKRQDFALWLVMLEKFDFAHSLKIDLASYRIRENSLSKNKFDAFKYYWLVLRGVAKLNPVKASYFTLKYTAITFIKKKAPALYEKLFTGGSYV